MFALGSLFTPLLPYTVPIIVLCILGVMTINLRGLRESGLVQGRGPAGVAGDQIVSGSESRLIASGRI